MIDLYGIPNCNTVKKSLDFFKLKNIELNFHNFKTEGISKEKFEEWVNALGINNVINKKSATYRKLTDEEKHKLDALESAITVIKDNTSIIKRPVVEFDGKYLLGFDEEIYEKSF